MSKKLIIATCILIASIVFSFSVCFANDASNMLEDAANGVRNVVGGAENAVEDAAGGIANTAKNATEGVENGMNKASNSVSNTMSSASKNNNGGYTATRTATDEGAATFMGMTATAWTWLIMGIAAIAIVALVWYYSSQLRTSHYDDNDRF